MSETKNKPKVKPEITIRKGAVAASIWKRQAPSGYEYYDYSLSRSWKSSNTGREGYSPNFFANNEEQILQVVQEATLWISQHLGDLKLADSENVDPYHLNGVAGLS